jgi:hypothetical protein
MIDKNLIPCIVESFGDAVKQASDYQKLACAIKKKSKKLSDYQMADPPSRYKKIATRYTGMSADKISLIMKHHSKQASNTGIKVNTPVLKSKEKSARSR